MVISASLQACGVVFPFAMLTSICRSIVTICSGLYLFIGMTASPPNGFSLIPLGTKTAGHVIGDDSQSVILCEFSNHGSHLDEDGLHSLLDPLLPLLGFFRANRRQLFLAFITVEDGVQKVDGCDHGVVSLPVTKRG